MPDTRLILHVKGTESETSELPKDAVRAAISQGKITHSQLIWSPAENAWKQVREWPDLLPPIEQLILHVKGTEAETRQLPKQEVRAGISQGQITHSQLIWSPNDNAWKQVRELPELLPSQKLAPAPAPSTHHPKPTETITPETAAGPVERAAVAAGNTPRVRGPAALTGSPKPKVAVAGPPKVRVATPQVATPQAQVPSIAAATPKVKVATVSPTAQKPRVAAVAATAAAREAAVAPGRFSGSLEVKDDDQIPLVKWICIALGLLIVLVLGFNFLLVDQPLVSKFSKTNYGNVTVYAHLGAFMQPNVMVIHIPASSKITPDNLPDVLIALAHSTPNNPVTGNLFSRIAITSGWTAQYSFSDKSWKALADEDQESAAQRKEYLMGNMDDAAGQSILPESTLNEEAQRAKREQIWKTFVAHFTK